MRRKFPLVLCGIVLLNVSLWIFCSAPGYALSAVDVFKRYSPSVATLVVTRQGGREAQGTGFLVSSRGELLTNFHVVNGAESIGVYFSDNIWYSAKRVIAQDPAKDLALVWIERVSPSLYPLSLHPLRTPEGSDLIVIGTPHGLEKSVTTGILSGYRVHRGSSLIQFTAPVSPGSSGSPVFDTGGRVIGMVMGGVQDAQGMNFAVDAKEIARFLQTRPFLQSNAARSFPGSSTTPPLANTREPSQPRSFTDIVATVEMARPRSSLEQVRQKLGAPANQENRGQTTVNLWNYPNNNSVLLIWDRAGEIDRAEWIEYYSTKEAAAARSRALLTQASESFGRTSGTSQSGAAWKRNGYSLGIEQHSSSEIHMVTVKATQ